MEANWGTQKIVIYIELLCCFRATVRSCLMYITADYLNRLDKGEQKGQRRDIQPYK